MKKKVLAGILAAVMVVTSADLTSFATEQDNESLELGEIQTNLIDVADDFEGYSNDIVFSKDDPSETIEIPGETFIEEINPVDILSHFRWPEGTGLSHFGILKSSCSPLARGWNCPLLTMCTPLQNVCTTFHPKV